MLSILYSDDDGLLDITPYVNLSDANFKTTCNAEQGSVGTNTFTIDDPDGVLNIVGHRRVIVLEDEAPAEHQMIFWGYTFGRDISRVDIPTTVARGWSTEVVDINSLIARKVMGGNDNDRPAETDVERVQWLMTTGEAGFFDDTTTFIDTSSPVAMDAADYNGQMFSAVLDDCAQQSGKNYFALFPWDGGISDYRTAMWYGHDSLDTLQSTLQISNVLSDVDYADTWPPSLDSTLKRDPSRVFSGVFANYDGGFTYRTRPATLAIVNRDTVTSWPNVKTLAKAQARSDRYLVDLVSEEDVISTTLLLPPANVNDLMAGDRCDVRYSHFPDYGEFRTVRVLNRTVTFLTPAEYQVYYELIPILPPAPAGTCTTALASMQTWDSGEFHHVNETAPFLVSPSLTVTEDSIIIGLWATINQTEPVAGNGTPPFFFNFYTGIGNSRPTPGSGSYGSLAVVGYEAIGAGSADDMEFTDDMGTGSAARSWRSLFVSFPTTATTPVQTGALYNTGHTITLGGAPTEGNVLIMCRFGENGGYGPPNPPAGWATVAGPVSFSDTTGAQVIDILARCVGAGEGTSIETGNSSFSHWAFVSEWVVP